MSKDQIQNLLVARIKVRRNVRKTFDKEGLNGLLESMKQHGLLEPIRVQSDGDWFVVVNGESRLRCAQQLKWETIPGIVETRQLSECDVVERQLVENLQRTDLPPLEKAQGIHELMQLGKCNASQVATRLAISNADVTKSLALLRLPETIQAMIGTGAVPASIGYELAMIDDPNQQIELAEKVVREGVSRDALTAARKAASRAKEKPEATSLSRVTAMLGEKKSVTVAGQSLTLEDFIASLEECLSKARQGRTKGISLGTFIRMLKDTATSA